MIFRRIIGCVFAAGLIFANSVDARAAGAFAVGECGSYGYAYDYSEAEAARQAAIKKCDGDCQTIPVMHACAAFAVDVAAACGAHGYAAAPKLGVAQNSALKQCYNYGGKDCMIRAWICDAKGP
jgi:Domain of unknown function (DUF4189)